tara:strand:- start:17 stop:175 length:159 start_codon:yes stop_codon:yes gene_type:complete
MHHLNPEADPEADLKTDLEADLETVFHHYRHVAEKHLIHHPNQEAELEHQVK